jgi:hypothetical protein
MSVEFKYCEEGSLHSYVKVIVTGEDQNDDTVRVTEAITPQDLLRAAADLIDQSPYYKDFFDKRLLG